MRVHDDGPVGLDGVQVEFDDERVVSDAGVMLVATLARRLGVEGLAQRLVRLRHDRPGAANAGRKVMALVYAMRYPRIPPVVIQRVSPDLGCLIMGYEALPEARASNCPSSSAPLEARRRSGHRVRVAAARHRPGPAVRAPASASRHRA